MCGKGNDKCGFLHMKENGLKVGVDKGEVFLLFSTLYPFILHLLSTCFPHISPLCFPHGVDKVLFCCLVVLLFCDFVDFVDCINNQTTYMIWLEANTERSESNPTLGNRE